MERIRLKRGMLKNKNNYLSILLIPNSTEKSGVLQLSFLYKNLYILLAIALSVFICFGIFLSCVINENAKLKNNIVALTDLSVAQRDLINEKAIQLDEINEKDANTNRTIKDFMSKYSEMANKYMGGLSSSTKASRSGDRNDRSFVSDIKELRAILDSLDKKIVSDDASFTELKKTDDKLKKYIESLPVYWPASGSVSSKFGGRRDPFQFTKAFHEGIDIAADYGQNIRASGSGRVTFSGWYYGYGSCIIIDHGYGLTTLYGHASKLIAKSGQTVKKGDIIAKVGSSGRSTGSHLHFEVRMNGNPVNPLNYLDR